jgi:hypothetical protein
MTLKSAKDDIVKTLSCVPGLFGKICYLAMLRNEDGEYDHWGFNKTHGAELASASLHTAHKIIFGEVLRSPVPDLCSEVEIVSLERCQRNQDLRTHAVPDGTGKGPRLHFNAVVAAVSALAEAQRLSTHRDA